MRHLLAMLSLSAVAVAAPVPKDKPKDAEAIVGRWKLTEVQLGADGEKPRDDDTGWKTAVYEFRKDGTYAHTQKGVPPGEGTYTLDPTAAVKSFDLTAKGTTTPARCVYHLEGDTLKLCVGRNPEIERPAELKADAKSSTHVWVFERIKEK